MEGLIPAGFTPEALTLDLDVDLVATEGLDESAQGCIGIVASADGSQGRTLPIAAECDEA